MIRDDQWPVARLIPISSASGVEAQERRLASALLAVMHAVPEFARALLKPLGAPAGRPDTFIEVPFKLGERTIRPDGILAVTRGAKTWSAIVETKTAANPLQADQMNIYLDLARELEFDAVLSISNQYVSSSTGYPIEVDRRKLKKVALHHWSWIDVLTEAIVQKEHRGVGEVGGGERARGDGETMDRVRTSVCGARAGLDRYGLPKRPSASPSCPSNRALPSRCP